MKIISHITTDEKNQFKEVDFNQLLRSKKTDSVDIIVNKNVRNQEIDGFGASFTDSSAFLIFWLSN